MLRHLSLIAVIILLNACASTGNSPTQAKVERISAEELAKIIPPASASVSLEELVADAKQGKTADELIAKIKASNSRYELTPTRSLELNKQGLDLIVLDFIHESNELAKQNAVADEINKRQQEKVLSEQKLKRERNLARLRYYNPFWGLYYGVPHYGSMPYGFRNHYLGPRFGWGLGYGYPH